MRRVALLCAVLCMCTTAAVAWGRSTSVRPAAGHRSHKTHVKATKHSTAKKSSKKSTKKSSTKKTAKGAASSNAAAATTTDPVLFGNQAVESGTDNNTAGLAEAFPFSGHISGTARSVDVYIDSHSTAKTVLAALYADSSGRPGSLLASGTLSSPKAGAWNALPISATTVSASKSYWIAVLGKGGTMYFRDRAFGSCESVNSSQTGLSAMPSTWTNGAQWSTCPVSAYVSGTAAAVIGSSGPPTTTTATTTTTTATTTTTPPATVPPLPVAPLPLTAPQISGTATEGQTLSSDNGTWLDGPTSYAYQWQDCNTSGASCSNISGATASSYTLTANEVGDTVRAVVTGTDAGGSASATSNQTATVASSAPAAPTNTALPTISGTATQGQALTVSNGSWTGNPSFTYQWRDCNTSGATCSNISGATSNSYTLTANDVGDTVRAVVTGTNAGGSASATSNQTATVAASGGGGGGTGTPANSALPSISGTPEPGDTLTATAGTWSGSPSGYSYQWYDEATPISGATGSTYTVVSSDVDHTIDVTVTASNASGSSSAAASTSTGVVVQACDMVVSSASAIVSDMQNTANSGKVICAAPGSYNIASISAKQASMTTLEAEPGQAQPTLSGGIGVGGTNLRIEGFALADGFYTMGMNHLRIVGNYFHDCTACGSLLFINNSADVGDFTVAHNRMINVKQNDAFQDGYGIYGCTGNPTNINVLYNTFQNMNQHPDETTCDGMNIVGNEIDHAYYDSSTPDQHVDCIEIWGGASNINIQDNRCEDTTGANQTQGMLLSGDTKNGKLINNLIVDINDQCVDDTPNGTSSTSFSSWTVENNTIDNCGNTWGGGGVGGTYGFDMNGPSSTGNVFEYNVFSSWETNGSSNQFSTDTNNDVKQGAPGSGDITTAPQYVDHHNWQTTNLPSNWGYHPARVGYQANMP